MGLLFEQEHEDCKDELRQSETRLKFDHLYCAKCRRCVVFREYVPFTEAARRIGCRHGQMQIWNTPCPKCKQKMDVTNLLSIEDLLARSCCIERYARLERTKQIKRICSYFLFLLFGLTALIIL